MPELPVLKCRTLLSALSKLGFRIVSQRGSHLKLKKFENGEERVVIVPVHDEIRRGTLLSIIRQAGLTKEQFLQLLQ